MVHPVDPRSRYFTMQAIRVSYPGSAGGRTNVPVLPAALGVYRWTSLFNTPEHLLPAGWGVCAPSLLQTNTRLSSELKCPVFISTPKKRDLRAARKTVGRLADPGFFPYEPRRVVSPHEVQVRKTLLEKQQVLGWKDGEFEKPYTVPEWEDVNLSTIDGLPGSSA